MKIRVLSVCLLLLILAANHAGAENKEFENFANTEIKLMHDAYTKKDVKSYKSLLDQFTNKFNQLNTDDRKMYTSYLSDSYYNYACVFALLNDKESTLKYIKKAIDAGYVNYKHITEDSDLASVRDDKKFAELVNPLRNIGDYLYIIKKAGAYNNQDSRPFPAFTYQSADNRNLVALRKAFNLDSIAGSGNDVSKIISLMYWLHNLIPHDGIHGNPAVKNAISMITVCKKENRGLNCRGLATVLNECFLSMGFRSRFITCLPKDSLNIDNDCHVIDMVFIPSLKKWIWIDPTFCAYVMNEKGDLLGIEEVRQRIITGQPLIINPDANWNHKSSESKEDYLYDYMAKNLYRLQCETSSEYDSETIAPGKRINYVQLLPLEYFKQGPDKTENTNSRNTTYDYYLTNNAQAFWAAPQN